MKVNQLFEGRHTLADDKGVVYDFIRKRFEESSELRNAFEIRPQIGQLAFIPKEANLKKMMKDKAAVEHDAKNYREVDDAAKKKMIDIIKKNKAEYDRLIKELLSDIATVTNAKVVFKVTPTNTPQYIVGWGYGSLKVIRKSTK